jgi:hypothetical protein
MTNRRLESLAADALRVRRRARPIPCVVAIAARAAILVGLVWGQVAAAAYETHVHPDTFLAASVSVQDIQDLDSLSLGIIVTDTMLGPITYSYAPSDYTLALTDAFPGISGANTLGTDTEDGAFIMGDAVVLTFDRTVQGFGLVVLVEEKQLGSHVFKLTTDTGATARSTSVPYQSIAGGDAYFIGVVDEDGMDSVMLTSVALDDFPFSVDGLVLVDTAKLPEPGAALAGCVAIGLVAALRRRSRLTR